MSVVINLKEIFPTDSQSETSSKLNFNFNQLLALGVGQPGQPGERGPVGNPGPIGPRGLIGEVGSLIFGTLPPVQEPAPNPSTLPSELRVNDLLITESTVLKKVDISVSSTGWQKIADFNTLVQNALGSNVSPYVKLTPTSRVIKPRVTAGLDLSNSATSSDPSFPTAGLGQNYQTVLYNFNELKTSSVILSGGVISINSNTVSPRQFSALTSVNVNDDTITINSHGFTNGQYVTYSTEGGTAVGGLTNFSGYYILVVDSNLIKLCDSIDNVTNGIAIDLTSTGSGTTPHRLITYPVSPDLIFPATSNLSLYSFFNNTAQEAKQFDTNSNNKGYRYQLELGSVDPLTTSYSDGVTGPAYVISPSFENLRIRKYRLAYVNTTLGTESSPGKYFLKAEYDLSSDGIQNAPESFSPRRNSEQSWKINKAGASANESRRIELKLTNSVLLEELEASSGIMIDGLFLKREATFDGTSGSASYMGLGFSSTNPSSFNFQLSDGLTFSFNRSVNIGFTRINSNGIEYLGAAGTTWTILASGRNISLAATKVEVVGNLSTTGTLTLGTVLDETRSDHKSLVVSPNGEVKKITASPIPLGGIIMWSGTIAEIPAGWSLCNGQNGTPDLRSRFIVGAGSDSSTYSPGQDTIGTGYYKVGDIGGQDLHTLSESEIPSHRHYLAVPTGQANQPDLTANNFLATVHNEGKDGNYVLGGVVSSEPSVGQSGLSGGGNAHESRPPYYALAFIMYTGISVSPTTTTTLPAPATTTTSSETTTTSTTVAPTQLNALTAYTTQYITTASACSPYGQVTTLYHSGLYEVPEVGDRIYTNSSGTIGYNGSNAWTTIINPFDTVALNVSTAGFVLDVVFCAGGGGGGGCLVEGTQITMADGSTKSIENLVIGDQLMSYDIDGLPRFSDDPSVLNTWSTANLVGNSSTAELTNMNSLVANLLIVINGSIRSTETHRHLVKVDGTWSFIEAREVKVGDIIFDISGQEIQVETVSFEVGEFTVYDLDVETLDVFYANGMLTHNNKLPTEQLSPN